MKVKQESLNVNCNTHMLNDGGSCAINCLVFANHESLLCYMKWCIFAIIVKSAIYLCDVGLLWALKLLHGSDLLHYRKTVLISSLKTPPSVRYRCLSHLRYNRQVCSPPGLQLTYRQPAFLSWSLWFTHHLPEY